MYFVGVDLAWAGRNPTGVAAVDADGCLVGVGAARDDASVLAALRPYVVGDCLSPSTRRWWWPTAPASGRRRPH